MNYKNKQYMLTKIRLKCEKMFVNSTVIGLLISIVVVDKLHK